MSDETATNTAPAAETTPKAAGPSPIDTILGFNPSSHPMVEAIQENLGNVVPPTPESEPDGQVGVEMSPEEIINQYNLDPNDDTPATPAQEPEPETEEEAAAPGLFDDVLGALNTLAAQALGQNAVAAPAAPPVAPPPAPVAPPAPVQAIAPQAAAAPDPALYMEPMNDEKLYEIATDPQAYQRHMAEFAQKVQLATMQQMQPAMYRSAIDAYHLVRLEEDITAELPGIVEKYPNVAILAVQQAREKMPNADYGKLKAEVIGSLKAVASKVGAIQKTAETRNMRGVMAPKSASRTTRPLPGKVRRDPTEEAFAAINSAQAGNVSDLLQIIGA